MARVLWHRRRGSMYVLVAGCATLTAVVGIAALMALRVERRTAEGASDTAEARVYAQSAVEIGMQLIAADPDWRSRRSNGAWQTDRPIGAGTYSLSVVDPGDGDLSDSPADSVVLTATGVRGRARQMLQVTLSPTVQPLEALNTCLHAAGPDVLKSGTTVTVSGAPFSSNGTVQNNGTIVGDLHALVLSGSGSVSGTITVPAPNKPMPDASVLALYQNKATVIPSSSVPMDASGLSIDRQVLGPGLNPWGAANAEGVYYIDTGANDLTIKRSRINGTLIVHCGPGKSVILDDTVFIHSFRSDYPALIVDGQLDLRIKSTSYGVVESDIGANLNPTGAPYLSVTDSDQSDTYPNEVHGLVHVTGAAAVNENSKVKGVVICENAVTCNSSSAIAHDPVLYQNPPEGYRSYSAMKIEPGSWRQIVD